MPARLYLESFATVLLDDGAETRKNEGMRGAAGVNKRAAYVRRIVRGLPSAGSYGATISGQFAASGFSRAV
jgi:hypothetical protein